MAKLFEKVDDNPGDYFGMLVENWEELNESRKVEYLEADLAEKSGDKDIYDAYDENELTIVKDGNVYYMEHCPNELIKKVKTLMKKYYPNLVYLYDIDLMDYPPQIESLKESKSGSKETAKEIAKQFGVNPKIVSTKLGYYRIPVEMLLGDFIEKAKDNGFINAGNKNIFYKDINGATVFVEFDEKNSAIYIDFKYEKEESLKESVSKSDLYSALEYMYGFNKKEANDWIKKASDKMKQSVVDGWKGNAKKSALTDSLKEDKFVSRDKMSKKDRKELDSKKRNTWGSTNPVTKVQPNKKAYDRKRDKKELDEDINSTVLDNRTRSAVKEGAMSLQYITDLLFDAIDDSNSTYGDIDNTINEIRKIANFLQDVYYRYIH